MKNLYLSFKTIKEELTPYYMMEYYGKVLLDNDASVLSQGGGILICMRELYNVLKEDLLAMWKETHDSNLCTNLIISYIEKTYSIRLVRNQNENTSIKDDLDFVILYRLSPLEKERGVIDYYFD